MNDLLVKTAREVLEDLHNGTYDNERIEDGAYEILSGVVDALEKANAEHSSGLPSGYAEVEYDNFENAEAIDGAKFDDLNYLRYTER